MVRRSRSQWSLRLSCISSMRVGAGSGFQSEDMGGVSSGLVPKKTARAATPAAPSATVWCS